MSYGGTASGDGAGEADVLRSKVDSVKGVMKQNIEKITERGENLENLGDKAAILNQDAHLFERNAVKLKRKYWWKNFKLWLILIAIIVFIFLVIAGIIAIVVVTQT